MHIKQMILKNDSVPLSGDVVPIGEARQYFGDSWAGSAAFD